MSFLTFKEKTCKDFEYNRIYKIIYRFIIYHLFFYVMQIDRGFRVFEPV